MPVYEQSDSLKRLVTFSEEYQPSKYIEQFYPTALLIQVGEKDQHYNLNKVKRFYEEVKQYYSDFPDRVKLIIYPDVGHEFKQEMWEEVLQWLNNNL